MTDDDREFDAWAEQFRQEWQRDLDAMRERKRGPELTPVERETYVVQVALALLDGRIDYVNAACGEAPFAPQVNAGIFDSWMAGLHIRARLVGSDLRTVLTNRLAELKRVDA